MSYIIGDSAFKDVNYYYPAWDKTYSKIEMQNKLKDAYEIVETIGKIVTGELR